MSNTARRKTPRKPATRTRAHKRTAIPESRLVFTISEFCAAHNISRAFYYLLKARGEGPARPRGALPHRMDAEARGELPQDA